MRARGVREVFDPVGWDVRLGFSVEDKVDVDVDVGDVGVLCVTTGFRSRPTMIKALSFPRKSELGMRHDDDDGEWTKASPSSNSGPPTRVAPVHFACVSNAASASRCWVIRPHSFVWRPGVAIRVHCL